VFRRSSLAGNLGPRKARDERPPRVMYEMLTTIRPSGEKRVGQN
jgi:hypothetical protein